MSKRLTVKHKTVTRFTLDREFIVCDEDCSFAWNYETGDARHDCYGCCLNRISDNASLAEFRDEFPSKCPNDGEVMILLDAKDVSELQMLLDELIIHDTTPPIGEVTHYNGYKIDNLKRITAILGLEVRHE